MRAVVRHLPVPTGRVIALSDVHGNKRYLRGALEQVRFGKGDTLVIVGDLLEKGPDSLGTLRLVMDIARENTVHWVQGNCDPVTEDLLDPAQEKNVANWTRMSPHRLTREMMAEIGLTLDALDDMDAFRRTLLAHFPQELAFMQGLAHVLSMGRYVFVHGGITDAPLEAQQDAYAMMKNDDYLKKGYAFDRWVVVGHWPTQLHAREGMPGTPLVEAARHIVSIDGGCVLKDSGQLNVMMIPDAGQDAFSFAAYDELERFTAASAQQGAPAGVCVLYTDSAVHVLRRGEHMSEVRQKSSGRVISAPTQLLYERADGFHLDDYTDYVLEVKEGDTLSRVLTVPDGVFAKDAQGRVGWYRGKVI